MINLKNIRFQNINMVLLLKNNLTYLSNIINSDIIQKITMTFLTRIALLAIGVISTVLITRALGPGGRGEYAIAMAVCTLGVQFGNLGIHISNTYYVAKNKEILNKLAGNTYVISIFFGAIISLIILMALWAWPKIAPIDSQLLLLVLIWVPFGLLYLLMQNLLIGIHDIKSYNAIDIFYNLFSLLLLLLIFWLGYISVTNVFLIYLISLVISTVCVVVRINTHSKGFPTPSWTLLKENLAYGLKAFIASFFAYMVLKVDLLLVQYFLDTTQTGYYSVAASIADMIYILPSVIGFVVFPRLCSINTTMEKWQLTKKITLATIIVMVLISIFTYLSAQLVITTMFGVDFMPAVLPLYILSIAMIFYGSNNIISNFLSSIGFPWISVWVWIVASILNVVVNVVLLPSYGISGAAFASVISYAAVFFIQFIYIKMSVKVNESN